MTGPWRSERRSTSTTTTPTSTSDRHDEWAKLRGCPVAHNSRFGGFWVVSGYDEVATVSRDAETFSSRHSPEAEDGIEWLGIAGVPRSRAIPTAGIAEVEGPLHLALRRVLNPHPGACRGRCPRAPHGDDRQLVPRPAHRVGSHRSRARLRQPRARHRDDGADRPARHQLAALRRSLPRHRRPPSGQPEYDGAVANIGAMLTELAGEVDARREQPRDDLLSALVQRRRGRPGP